MTELLAQFVVHLLKILLLMVSFHILLGNVAAIFVIAALFQSMQAVFMIDKIGH
jgi:hypothetical protein